MKTDILKEYVNLRNSLEQERATIQARLREIDAVLGGEAAPTPSTPEQATTGKPKRKVSEANRRAVSLAAKARWARYRAEKAGKVVEKAKAPASVAKAVAKFGNPMSLPQAVVQVTSQRPMTKQEILEAVNKLGYRFQTKKPLQSLNPILYGEKPKFDRADGKFSPANVAPKAVKAGKPKRKVSAAARKNIAAGKQAWWDKRKAEKAKR